LTASHLPASRMLRKLRLESAHVHANTKSAN